MGLKISKSKKRSAKSVSQRPKTPQENENPKILEGKLYKLVSNLWQTCHSIDELVRS